MDIKHELVLPSDDIPFKIFLFEGFAGNYSVAKHWHQWIELFCVRKGTIDFYINNQMYKLSEGNCILVNQNEVHSMVAKDENEVIVMQIPLGQVQKYDSKLKVCFEEIPNWSDRSVYQYVCDIFDNYTGREELYEYKVLSIYYSLLYYLLDNYRNDHMTEENKSYSKNLDKMSEVTAYIDENYMKDISLSELANTFGFTVTYLSKVFKNVTGSNYMTYLEKVRLEHAYMELMNTDHTSTEVSFNNGFSSNKSFIEAFKKKYGMPPATYRRDANNR